MKRVGFSVVNEIHGNFANFRTFPKEIVIASAHWVSEEGEIDGIEHAGLSAS